jgi:hypothetical protein
VLLVVLNSQAIFGRYLIEPYLFAIRSEQSAIFLNLFGVALPDQIVPDFHLALSQPPVISNFTGDFSASWPDMSLTAIGLMISCTIAFGLWKSRSRMLPEILYVLAPLPVLGLIMPSTSRYLMAYQPFLWVFFYEGASAIRDRASSIISLSQRSRIIIAGSVTLLIAAVATLRWYRIAGTEVDRSYAVSVNRAPAYVKGVSTIFRSLRNYLETLPKDKTLLIGAAGTVGRWKVIAGRSYYIPDSALTSVAASKEVYLVVECGTLEYCQSFSQLQSTLQDGLCRFGEFNYQSVFAVRSKWARAEVFRVRPAA